MIVSRRNLVRYMSFAPAVFGTTRAGSSAFAKGLSADVTPAPHLGCITGNDPAGYLTFAKWFGRKPQLALLAFNQANAPALSSSIDYICHQGAAIMVQGAQILWSVPCPGSGQLENIVNRTWSGAYDTLFKAILAVSPPDRSPIYVRLPWEFNLVGQQNAAMDAAGKWNAPLFIKAWQVLSDIVRRVSPRFKTIWCPNVTIQALDPALCWPGDGYVDIVAQDFYMQSAYNHPGDFSYFLNEQRGLQWGAEFAAAKGKPYGLSEWGMSSDMFVGDLKAAASWLSGLGSALHHHCWWDRAEVIDCRISDGTHPRLAAAYKTAFY